MATQLKPRSATPHARRGPILSDGVALGDLIDFENREVAMRMLSDPEIYRLEQERIFGRAWIGLAHADEIPSPGDYVVRSIGEDSVIIARGRDGEIDAFLNACSHRGMEVCWADKGNQQNFKCPYHGWVFDLKGNLLGAPLEREMYGDWDKRRFGLTKVRVEVYKRLIFGTFDADAMPLEAWLGDASYYLELPYQGQNPAMEIIDAPHRFRVKTNWKVTADNNCGDGYHGISLHHSLVELGISKLNPLRTLDTVKISTAHGHAFHGFSKSTMMMNPAIPRPEGYPIDDYTFSCNLFPATMGLGGGQSHRMPGADGQSYLVTNIGGVSPRGPDEYEIWFARMVEKDAPAAVKSALKAMHIASITAGVDDLESWPSMQRVARGRAGARQRMRYNAVAGENRPAGWPGPGRVYAGISKDDNQWDWWCRWFEMMTADAAV